jgi:DNA replication and repair protein RecF
MSCGVSPLLLLDDVSSELDPDRNELLMRYLAAGEAQVFITTTDPRLVRGAVGEGAKYYRVRSGAVAETTAGES